MIITALDMSLTATGWATTHAIATRETSGVLTPPKHADRGTPRLRWIRRAVMEIVQSSNLVVIEGYAFGAKGNAVINLGELGGVIRLALADRGLPFVEIPPSCVKLFATAKGNAPKDEVLGAAIRKLSYNGHDHNEADALWLLEMAKARYEQLWSGNDAQERALSKIEWSALAAPRVTAEAV